MVETFGAWGRTAGQFFGELASRLAAQSHSSKTIMLNNIYGRLSLTLVRANARAFNARVVTTMDVLESSCVVTCIYMCIYFNVNKILLLKIYTVKYHE